MGVTNNLADIKRGTNELMKSYVCKGEVTYGKIDENGNIILSKDDIKSVLSIVKLFPVTISDFIDELNLYDFSCVYKDDVLTITKKVKK